MVPHTMNRIVAFIRPCIGAGADGLLAGSSPG